MKVSAIRRGPFVEPAPESPDSCHARLRSMSATRLPTETMKALTETMKALTCHRPRLPRNIKTTQATEKS